MWLRTKLIVMRAWGITRAYSTLYFPDNQLLRLSPNCHCNPGYTPQEIACMLRVEVQLLDWKIIETTLFTTKLTICPQTLVATLNTDISVIWAQAFCRCQLWRFAIVFVHAHTAKHSTVTFLWVYTYSKVIFKLNSDSKC